MGHASLVLTVLAGRRADVNGDIFPAGCVKSETRFRQSRSEGHCVKNSANPSSQRGHKRAA